MLGSSWSALIRILAALIIAPQSANTTGSHYKVNFIRAIKYHAILVTKFIQGGCVQKFAWIRKRAH